MAGKKCRSINVLKKVALLTLLALAVVFCAGIDLRNARLAMISYSPPPEQQFAVTSLNLGQRGQTGPKISLAGAKNEYLILPFRVQGADLATFKASVSGKGIGQGIEYKFYQLSWAAPSSRGKFTPDALKPLAQDLVDTGTALEIWAIIKISAGVNAGLYPQELTFSDQKASHKQPLELRVWNFTLPYDLPITIMGNFWGTDKWFIRYGVKSAEQFDSVVKAYLSSMREYKFNALGDRLYQFPVNKLVPGTRVEDTPGYHQLVNYALNDLKYRYFSLPRLPVHDKQNFMDPKGILMQRFDTYYSLFKDYLHRHRWENRAMNIILDEPEQKDFPKVYEVYTRFKKIAPSIKTYCTGRAGPEVQLAKSIDVWVIAGKFVDSAKIAAARNAGQEIWLYDNRLHKVRHPLVGPRLVGWLLYHHKFSGYYFWAVNHWDTDPWTGDDFRLRGGIFYNPDPANGLPLPTARLEALRRGFHDYQYLLLLDQARERGRVDPKVYSDIREAVNHLTKQRFSDGMPQATMAQLESLRFRIGEILNQ